MLKKEGTLTGKSNMTLCMRDHGGLKMLGRVDLDHVG